MRTLVHPRNTTAENDGYTGPASQIVVDSERWELRLHDNETPGGHRILNLAQLLLLFMSIDSEFGDVEFAPGDKGFLVRTGDREYTLRAITAGTGITVDNPLGTAGDVVISLGDLSGTIIASIAGRLPYAVTTGSAAAFAADFPTGWPNGAGVNGPVGIIKFHVAPADGATLSVDGATSYPLLTADGLNDVNRVAAQNTVAMLVRADDSYYLIGLTTPSNMGILPIAGIAATNVQDALEELKSEIDGITGGSVTAQRFQVPAIVVQDLETAEIPIADGEYVWVAFRSLGTLSTLFRVRINGVESQLYTDVGYSFQALFYRLNGKLYTSKKTELVGEGIAAFPSGLSTAFVEPDIDFHSNIATPTFNVTMDGNTSLPKIGWTGPAVPFVP